jgi:hypothetical protein
MFHYEISDLFSVLDFQSNSPNSSNELFIKEFNPTLFALYKTKMVGYAGIFSKITSK